MTAESLFEAAILAVRAFRRSDWIEHIGQAASIDVEVRAPLARHTLTLTQVERWLDGASISPSETLNKKKLRELLTAG